MSKKTFQDFQDFLEENMYQNTIFHFHEIRGFKVAYRSENTELKGTLNSRSLLGKTASAWELFNELEVGSIAVTIKIPNEPSVVIYDK